jgi:hypothetical protein
MKIHPKAAPAPTIVSGATDSPERGSRQPSRTPAAGHRTDSVEWSARGKELSGSGALSAERLTEIRARIDARFYDSPQVADAVARRLLATGDV